MPVSRLRVIFVFLLLAGVIPYDAHAEIPLGDEGKWNLFGRFRLRFEQDNDRNPSRPNRSRIRVGNYAGIRFDPNETWRFVARARTGAETDARILDSTVLVDNGYSLGRRGIFLDEYFATYQLPDSSELTVGRSTFPFWANTEKLWDQDLSPVGASYKTERGLGTSPLSVVMGVFHMPDGMQHFHAWMQGAQLSWSQRGNDWNWQGAFSIYNRPGEPGARYLLQNEGERDYLIGQFSARLTGEMGGVPAYVGVDVFENIEGYSSTDPDPRSSRFRDETTGYAVAFNLGQNKKRGDWRIRYVYARVEALAAFSSYATTSFGWLNKSNVIVHDVRADYSFTDKWRVTGRIAPAEEIIGTRQSTRYRIDFSRSF